MKKDMLSKEDLEILYSEFPEIKNYDLEDVFDGVYDELDLRFFENAKDLFGWLFEGKYYGKIENVIITENYLNKTFAEGYVDSLENTIKLTNGKYVFMFI